MADTRFFTKAAPLSLGEAAAITGAELAGAAHGDAIIADIGDLAAPAPDACLYAEKASDLAALAQACFAACFIKPDALAAAPTGKAYLLTPDPRRAFAQVAARLYASRPIMQGVSEAAHIDASARIGAGCAIGPGAVVGPEAVIGAHGRIEPNAVIGRGVEIGEGCRVGAGAVVSHAILGARCIIHRGAMIGQDGFGFAPTGEGLLKIPQLGRVVIGDDVEIGAGATIDRGALRDTEIGSGTKIDNLVQIGHNVTIGRSCAIAGQAGVSGSCRIGDGVMLGGQAGLADHLTIGAGAQIAANAGVMHDIPAGERWVGAPAKPARAFFREVAAIAKLTGGKGLKR